MVLLLARRSRHAIFLHLHVLEVSYVLCLPWRLRGSVSPWNMPSNESEFILIHYTPDHWIGSIKLIYHCERQELRSDHFAPPGFHYLRGNNHHCHPSRTATRLPQWQQAGPWFGADVCFMFPMGGAVPCACSPLAGLYTSPNAAGHSRIGAACTQLVTDQVVQLTKR